jgi:hypothetical protein
MGQIDQVIIDMALEKALGFLGRSIDVNEGRGSSHSYSFWMNPADGWHYAYPETTGYLLPTMKKVEELDTEWTRKLESCAQWLVDIQDEAGWWYGGLFRENGPSVFNTAVIAEGMINSGYLYQYNDSICRAMDWVVLQQEDDGSFVKHAYVKGHFPTYFTMVAAALIRAGLSLNRSDWLTAGERCLEALLPRIKSNPMQGAGFHPDKPAFLHTVAYTLEGWQYALTLLQRDQHHVKAWLDDFEQVWKEGGRWPGALWPDNYTFQCWTGVVQMLLCFINDRGWQPWMNDVLEQVLASQATKGPAMGALPGSSPFWGPYQRLRYPNWATRYLVEVLQKLNSL